MMLGRKPREIILSSVEREKLELLVKQRSTAQQLALRCRIILRAAAGDGNLKIAKDLGVSVDTVCEWRKRWAACKRIPLEDISVEERLEDALRSGCPSRISAEQYCQIMAVACEDPKDSGRPITQWSNREIVDEVIKRGIIKSISPRQVGRFFKRCGP